MIASEQEQPMHGAEPTEAVPPAVGPAGLAPSSSGPQLGPTPPEPFVMRIVHLDYYMATPLPGMDCCWSELEGGPVQQVPVIRIFGATPAGQRACLHLHNCLPYFYVPYPPDLAQTHDSAQAQQFIRRLALALDQALSMSTAYQQQQQQQSGAGPGMGGPGPQPAGWQQRQVQGSHGGAKRRQHVYAAALVRGTAFYGFHDHESLWIKLVLYRPQDVTRAANLMLGGAVMGQPWQPHESHITYLLQLKVDYNLYGMGWIRLAEARFRHPLPHGHTRQRRGWAHQDVILEQEPATTAAMGAVSAGTASVGAGSSSQSMRLWTAANTPSSMQWGGSGSTGRAPPRSTRCELELDARAEHILNRAELVRIPLREAGPEVRMVESLAPMWAEEQQRCGASGIPPPPASPQRSPQPLSAAVDAVREQFEAVAAQQRLQGVLIPDAEEQERQPPQPLHSGAEVAATELAEEQGLGSMEQHQATPGSWQGFAAGGPGLLSPFTPWAQVQHQTQQAAPPALLATTQAANRVVFSPGQPSSAASLGAAAANATPSVGAVASAQPQQLEQQQEHMAEGTTPAVGLLQAQQQEAEQLVDEQLLMTQLTRQQRRQWQQKRRAELHSQGAQEEGLREEEAEDTAGEGEEGVHDPQRAAAMAWLQQKREAAEHGMASSDEEGHDAEPEDMLLALAARAASGTPMHSQGSLTYSQSAGGARWLESGGGRSGRDSPPGSRSPLGSQPSMSQKEQAEAAAQMALERYLSATQRECEHILAAAAGDEPEEAAAPAGLGAHAADAACRAEHDEVLAAELEADEEVAQELELAAAAGAQAGPLLNRPTAPVAFEGVPLDLEDAHLLLPAGSEFNLAGLDAPDEDDLLHLQALQQYEQQQQQQQQQQAQQESGAPAAALVHPAPALPAAQIAKLVRQEGQADVAGARGAAEGAGISAAKGPLATPPASSGHTPSQQQQQEQDNDDWIPQTDGPADSPSVSPCSSTTDSGASSLPSKPVQHPPGPAAVSVLDPAPRPHRPPAGLRPGAAGSSSSRGRGKGAGASFNSPTAVKRAIRNVPGLRRPHASSAAPAAPRGPSTGGTAGSSQAAQHAAAAAAAAGAGALGESAQQQQQRGITGGEQQTVEQELGGRPEEGQQQDDHRSGRQVAGRPEAQAQQMQRQHKAEEEQQHEAEILLPASQQAQAREVEKEQSKQESVDKRQQDDAQQAEPGGGMPAAGTSNPALHLSRDAVKAGSQVLSAAREALAHPSTTSSSSGPGSGGHSNSAKPSQPLHLSREEVRVGSQVLSAARQVLAHLSSPSSDSRSEKRSSGEASDQAAGDAAELEEQGPSLQQQEQQQTGWDDNVAVPDSQSPETSLLPSQPIQQAEDQAGASTEHLQQVTGSPAAVPAGGQQQAGSAAAEAKASRSPQLPAQTQFRTPPVSPAAAAVAEGGADSDIEVVLSGFATPATRRRRHEEQAQQGQQHELQEGQASLMAEAQAGHEPAGAEAAAGRQQGVRELAGSLEEVHMVPVAPSPAATAQKDVQQWQQAELEPSGTSGPSPTEVDALADGAAYDVDMERPIKRGLPDQQDQDAAERKGAEEEQQQEQMQAERQAEEGAVGPPAHEQQQGQRWQEPAVVAPVDGWWVRGAEDDSQMMMLGDDEHWDSWGWGPPGAEHTEEGQEAQGLAGSRAQDAHGEAKQAILLRYSRPPPTQEELSASLWDEGLLPVVAPQPFYGQPAHRPQRPVVFAGREFKIPSAAVHDLPAFSRGVGGSSTAAEGLGEGGPAGPLSAWQLFKRRLAAAAGAAGSVGQQPRDTLVFVPARPPPTRAQTDAWLAARQRRRRRQLAQRSVSGGGASFGMDPNTGKLLPAAGVGAGAAEAGDTGGPPGAGGEGDLLATPSLCTLGSGGTGGGTPATDASARHTGGGSHGSSEDEGGSDAEEEHEPLPRPPSPKYDERSFFHSFVNPYHSASQLPSRRPASTDHKRRHAQQQQEDGKGDAVTPAMGRLCAPGSAAALATTGQRLSRLGMRPGGTPEEAGGSQQGATEPEHVASGQLSTQHTPRNSQQQQEQQALQHMPLQRQSVLRSALKAAAVVAAGRGVESSQSKLHTDDRRQQLQQQEEGSQPLSERSGDGSGGSGSTRRRVAFASLASPAPQPQQHQEEAHQQHEQRAGADAPEAVMAAQRSPRHPSPLTGAAGTAPTAGTAGAEQAQRRRRFVSQISPASPGGGEVPTPYSQGGFKRCVEGKGQQLTLLCVELYADSRGSLLSDPRHDAVRAVALAVADDDEEVPDWQYTTRLLLFDDGPATAAMAAAVAPASAGRAGAAGLERGLQAASGALPDAAGVGHGPPGAADIQDHQQQQRGPLPLATTAPELPSLLTAAAAAAAPGEAATPQSARLRNPVAVDGLAGVQVDIYPSEAELFEAVVDAVLACDPDLLLGFEVQQASLGYLADRAAVLGLPSLLPRLSRILQTPAQAAQAAAATAEAAEQDGQEGLPRDYQEYQQQQRGRGRNPAEEYGWNTGAGLTVPGRVVLNVWRIMRGEVKLPIYTLQSCAAAVLSLRTPHVPQHQLAAWFRSGPAAGRWRCLSYLAAQARLALALLDRLDLVGRTGELARAFGIDFESVLTRGSQYRVESMMSRLAHTQNYLLLSASKEQVARQPAMECIPLVMEPQSRLYTDPVVVLDFQSLYPSMIIAYNLCFSTCMGRAQHAAGTAQLGAGELGLPPGTLRGPLAPDRLVISPNGVAFAPHEARPGVLPRLLQEILNTRIMVKSAMKRLPPAARVLLRCLNARQFGLKLIANVTYGYTAAGFSGRMPMAELADAIVQSGRETLENAIRMVEGHPTWRARVVYGDTDSLFVQLPGRTRQEAHAIGVEIAAAVTAANPPPVTLKMEKVYQPCVLQTKKRYCGFMWESPGQAAPVFDAKGIETVRRDSCPAVSKMLEQTLRILFVTKDLSQVRDYLERQWTKILSGRVSAADFVFAKEVRLGTYSPKAATIPPAALVATRLQAADPRAAPRFGERVRYVVVHGQPGARLSDMVVPPQALVEGGGRLHLCGRYYIENQINPALERVLSLVGADVRAWYAQMPRPQRMLPQKRPTAALPLLAAANSAGAAGRKAHAHLAQQHQQPYLPGAQHLPVGKSSGAAASTIDRYYLSRHCAVCDGLTRPTRVLCEACLEHPQLAAAVLAARWNRQERQYGQLARICLHCGGGGGPQHLGGDGGIVCDSLDCGVYYERRKAWQELQAAAALARAGLALLDDGS